MRRTGRFVHVTFGVAAMLVALPCLAGAQSHEQLQAGVRQSPSGREQLMVHQATYPATLVAMDRSLAGEPPATVPARLDSGPSVPEPSSPAARPSRRGRHALIGAGIGLVGGAAVGYIVGSQQDRTCTSGPYCGGLGRINALLYGLLGSGAGVVVGALVP